jgi:uncharacterized membrane protein (UPF0136 family)
MHSMRGNRESTGWLWVYGLAVGLWAGCGSVGWLWVCGLALALPLLLLVFFSIRYIKSSPRIFMPSGLMAILSLLIVLGVALTKNK